ncbi:hypothetical protein B296_00015717 [Ensete ventricosum]|uniref:DUF4408 domain-containing protein n=1 Tax=Ensete ventricosum TaxID=4639 RepID=A0A426YTG9_ENSVE|nr:hypothetical protein B296_00015717 [Ensete ventricosum]
MLGDSLPSVFASVYGWFTPTVLFVLLNVVIGSIAVASKSYHHRRHQHGTAADDDVGAYPGRFLTRSLSRSSTVVLDRLRSFNLHLYRSDEIPPPFEATPAPAAEVADEAPHPAPEAEGEHQHHEHLGRSQSDTKPTAAEMTPRLAVRMKKSASEKSAFAHFEEAVTAAVETADPDEGNGGDEVDARADDFINRFRHQLKLQRLASIMRYKEMLNRGS